jgi:DNA helicase-2/ATP-dependent DNA helicase PcrA
VLALAQAATKWGKPLLEVAAVADRVDGLRPNVRDAFARFAGTLAGLRESVGREDPAFAFDRIIDAVHYDAHLADEGAEGVERMENVRELIAGAAAWAEVSGWEGLEEGEEGEPGATAGTAIERYLTQSALLAQTDSVQGETGVTLLTVHMAKGLEWPVVAVAGLEDGLFPLARSAVQPGGVEEERRLCYVGLTRARERLYLSWARTRFRQGRMEMSEPSRFLETIPPAVLQERATTPLWNRGGNRARFDGAPPRRRPVERSEAFFAVEEESQDTPRYARGERVRHRKFGGGVVQGVSGGGRSLKITVLFDDPDIGAKQLLVAYAGLEREWETG